MQPQLYRLTHARIAVKQLACTLAHVLWHFGPLMTEVLPWAQMIPGGNPCKSPCKEAGTPCQTCGPFKVRPCCQAGAL
jgi:hypothetical protein